MKKVCSKCKIEKDITEFDKKKDGHSYHCKTCRKEYVNNHYNNNKQYYIDKAKKNNKKLHDKYIEYKESLNCTNCGISFKGKHSICDFHHIDSSDKEVNIATLSFSSVAFAKEIKKCIPLCANCHRLHHQLEE